MKPEGDGMTAETETIHCKIPSQMIKAAHTR